jgi:L-asparaginase/Glu-tRNA(Gln) amidotransferase subunit D
VNTDLDPNVALVKLNPGMTAENFSRALGGASGAVLEGTGTGHIKSDLYDVIMIFGKPTLITTQATYGGEWLGMYAGDRAVLNIANILLGGDMTSETGLVKLMWALRQRDLNSIMRANLAGEMSPRMAGK